MKEGAYDYVEKGGSIEELKKVVRTALQKKGLIENNLEEEKSPAYPENSILRDDRNKQRND